MAQGLQHTVERDDEGEEEVGQQRGNLRVRRHGGYGLCDRRVAERVDDPDHEVGVSSATRVKADEPVPDEEVDAAAEYVGRKLAKNLRGDKCGPVIHAAWVLSDLVHLASRDERDLDLVG